MPKLREMTVDETYGIASRVWNQAKLLPVADYEAVFFSVEKDGTVWIWRTPLMALLVTSERVVGGLDRDHGLMRQWLLVTESGEVLAHARFFHGFGPGGSITDEAVREAHTPKPRAKKGAA